MESSIWFEIFNGIQDPLTIFYQIQIQDMKYTIYMFEYM